MGNLARRQGDDGAWAGDYGGPMFLLPMYIALCHAAGRVPRGAERDGMVSYLSSAQRSDGSVGLHIDDVHPSAFCTTLTYVALRILGVSPNDPRLVKMRAFLRNEGSPLGAASWGKFTLCLLGLYDWDGIHPVLPELWLLPYASPMHPARLWCHCRQVYLPMAWLYGKRATMTPDALVHALREELYGGRWSTIDWKAQRDVIAACDAYRAPTRTLRAAQRAMDAFESVVRGGPLRRLRGRALAAVQKHIVYEDEVTNFVDIGPVNKVLDAFVALFDVESGPLDPEEYLVHDEFDALDGAPAGLGRRNQESGENEEIVARGADSADSANGAGAPQRKRNPRFERAFAACDEYLFRGHDGTKMQGYNSSKLWDVAFATQAILAAGATANEGVLARAYDYLRDNQITTDVPDRERYFRHASRGGWPFSNRAHGWPITDCTSEGLKCALALEGRFDPSIPSIPEPLLEDAVALILSWQNDDGGWATYERTRGGSWLEALNPSQVFGDIMIDYSYVECTSACMQALRVAEQRFGGDIGERARRAIRRGERFLRRAQRSDGSFEGSWAVCFTYGTWFGVSGLLAAGARRDDPAITSACAFLLDIQRADGGWGEHGESCRERRYVPSRDASVVQTSWALSTLVRAGNVDRSATSRAARLLVDRQEADGSWAREPLVGVFNKTCLIDYDNYRHYFPLWALAEWSVSARAR